NNNGMPRMAGSGALRKSSGHLAEVCKAPYADIPEPSQVQFKRRLIVCCSPVDLKHCAAVESAEDQPFRPTGVQPDRKEDSSEQFCREIMLKRSIERSRLLVGYSFATAAREQWPVVLGDHLL